MRIARASEAISQDFKVPGETIIFNAERMEGFAGKKRLRDATAACARTLSFVP